MEMQQVRYFLSVAKTLNFTRAAEQCNVTQPALTRAIKQLEDELGGELIRREGRHSHLTDLGLRMLPLLTQCHESALNAKVLAAKVRSGDVATLAVGVSVTLDVDLLLVALAELQRAFAGLQLVIRRGNGSQIADWLKNGEIELAFGGPLGESWDRLDCWPMFTEAFDLVVANDHELAMVNDMDLQVDLIGKERLLLHSLLDGSELTTSSLEAAGVRVRDAHQVSCNRDLEKLMLAKFGVAILPASSFRSPHLRHLHYPGLDLRRTVAVYSIAGRPRSREAAALLSLVRAADWSSTDAA
ncbi:LysR family transcriptional regulator [Novosphingobium sp.]|uniref:LysR family transcriptional regulator n=1 Tax=Novosphingobium sp. TaxID=1874826 RepID=UPI0025CE9BAB|nr:LysR family transcriptional regulator [Novosphingobium sp.]